MQREEHGCKAAWLLLDMHVLHSACVCYLLLKHVQLSTAVLDGLSYTQST